MPTVRDVCEIECPSASIRISRARRTHPAAMVGRRSQLSSSQRSSAVRTIFNADVRPRMANLHVHLKPIGSSASP
jgi:hypothetical protein